MSLPLRELRRQCERFTNRLIAEGADPGELVGLLIGSLMRHLRERGVSRELYVQGCELLWDDNNPSNAQVDQEG